MIRKTWICIGLVFAVACPRAVGTRMVPLTIEQLARDAELVVHARVVARHCQQDAGGRVFTRVELQVVDLWKGRLSSGRVEVVHGGGVLGERVVSVEGQAEYNLGEEVVAYLIRNSRGETVTVGLAQGRFHVDQDPGSGRRYAVNLFWGGTPAPGGPTPAGPGQLIRPLSLEELKRRTQEAAR